MRSQPSHVWSSALLLAVLGCTHGEPRPTPRVVEEPQSSPVNSGAIDRTGVPATTPPAAETSPCAHLSDRLAYLPATATELCDAARCRGAGGECAPAGRVCPTACVRRSADSGKACTAREVKERTSLCQFREWAARDRQVRFRALECRLLQVRARRRRRQDLRRLNNQCSFMGMFLAPHWMWPERRCRSKRRTTAIDQHSVKSSVRRRHPCV
jgi:hypothetical protein